MSYVSIIIPLYNESNRIQRLFDSIDSTFTDGKLDLEIVFVNDGSVDNTKELVDMYIARSSLNTKVISYNTNRGKGFAIREGMNNSDSEWKIFLDADLSVSLDQVNTLVASLKKDDEIIIGSRNLPSSLLLVPPSSARRWLGIRFISLVNIFLGLSASDYTCGFKCFSKGASEKIFSRAREDRWVFDVELLCIARELSISYREIPVDWKNYSGSKIRIWRDIPVSFYALLRLYFKYR